MFENAKKQAPCIVFIDEIDAVGRHRGAGMGGGNDEREQTLNQMLVEMDGFEANSGVIVIAATNRADVLDKALLRPGRFDRQVYVGLPDIRGREQILKVHMRKVPIGNDVDASVLARGTPGFGRRSGQPGQRSCAEVFRQLEEIVLEVSGGGKVDLVLSIWPQSLRCGVGRRRAHGAHRRAGSGICHGAPET